MAKGPSKARESRVNISISDRLRGGAEPELPFRMLVMGDYTLKDDKRTVEDRQPLDINKSNFDSVMQSFNLSLDLTVNDRLAGAGELPVNLTFGNLKDFRPEAIARQVPQLKNLLELRDAMKALRPKLGDKAAQKELMGAIKDPAMRDQIVNMISQATDSGAPPAAEPAADAPAPDAPSDDGGGAPDAPPEGGGDTPPA
ncbi:MAG: type VI secretion system contractile sheath small subunit [Planctomycetota bacterium]|jgi:type VI secretion system protein ImpB